MNRTITTVITLAAVAALSTGCAKTKIADDNALMSSSSSQAGTSAPTPKVTPADDPVVAPPTPTSDFQTAKFGETGSFTQDDNTFVVNVAAPGKAKCQYSAIGCEKPKTGDRVVTAKVVVKNTSSAPIDIGSTQFILEFADGTRMEPNDGAASDYQPDNAMEYSQTMRPGSTYTSTLTFEAPTGPFSIVMLSGSFDGEDLFIWE